MPDPSSRFAAFIAELRRRRVFRVAIVYAGVAFIIFQIVDATFEPLRLPDWASTLVVVLLALGFPIAVGMAWAFDLTAEGLVRARESKRDQPKKPPRPVIGNKTLAVIAVLAVIAAAWSWLREPSPDGGPITSIAVLPLDNQMGDPSEDYFVEGMHDAIITNLARLSALKVISRTSAMRYKDTDKLLPEIARELNVDALVEGAVLKAGDRVRITAQLIHGASDEHLWSNDYEGDLTDILSLQKAVARAIAGEIGLALKPEEEAYLASAPQVNPEAYQAYLLGQQFIRKGYAPDLWRGIAQFEKAILLDSTYAEAYVGLANAYFNLAWANQYPPALAWPKIIAAGERALKLGDNLAGAHEIQAFIKADYDWDWPGAEKEYLRAIELNPASARSHWHQSYVHFRNDRLTESLESINQAIDLDPHYPRYYIEKTNILLKQGKDDGALNLHEYVLDTFPSWPYTHWFIAHLYAHQGRYSDALVEVEKTMIVLGEDIGDEIPFLGYLYAKLGRTEEARQQLERLDAFEAAGGYASHFTRSWVYIGLGEIDSALALIEKAMEERSTWLSFLHSSSYRAHMFTPLQHDPRYQAILKRLGYSQ